MMVLSWREDERVPRSKGVSSPKVTMVAEQCCGIHIVKVHFVKLQADCYYDQNINSNWSRQDNIHITLSSCANISKKNQNLYPMSMSRHSHCTLIAAQELLDSPLDREVSQVRVVLSHANKQHRYIGCMHQTDQRTDHISHSVTLGDDKAVECPHRAKSRIEVAGLSNRVCTDKSLWG